MSLIAALKRCATQNQMPCQFRHTGGQAAHDRIVSGRFLWYGK
jgi:hypothetical protein